MHHATNREIGRRVVFAQRADNREFMALMACAVRPGRIEIHALNLLGTHSQVLCRMPPSHRSLR